MGIYKDLRLPGIENLLKGAGVFGVCLDKVPVQVIIPAVAPEAISNRAVLIGP